jgi:hypothetical protein
MYKGASSLFPLFLPPLLHADLLSSRLGVCELQEARGGRMKKKGRR